MAFAGHHNDHAYGANEYSEDDKFVTGQISHAPGANAAVPIRTREAPPLVKNLSKEERLRLELALVRKIDRRLLPMVVLMYILNYLDRNNIASARLAGLQTELKLTSVQYEVRSRPLLSSHISQLKIFSRRALASCLLAICSCKVGATASYSHHPSSSFLQYRRTCS